MSCNGMTSSSHFPIIGISGKKKVSKKIMFNKKLERLSSRESNSEIDGASSIPKLIGKTSKIKTNIRTVLIKGIPILYRQ